jgi:DNA replication and repair protein RecF
MEYIMYIDTLNLENFRNYNNEVINFSPFMNIIYGDNAQGKTNILEAIYLMATSKSHRTSNFKEMIQLKNPDMHITANIKRDEINERIDIYFNRDGKKNIAINKMKINKMSELFGVMNVIMFSPEDLGIIKNGPKERRRFINIELCQVDKIYLYYLKAYHKVLKQRNNLLKTIEKDDTMMDQLEVWDIQLIENGQKLIKTRKAFITEINPIFGDIHYNISGKKEIAKLIYEYNVSEEEFKEKLTKRRMYDIRTGTTSVGPHRDDISFILNDVDIRHYGSQGQQRTAALSLKLSEIELVKQTIDDTPILLLDDVLSELDYQRQSHLIAYLKDIQTLITCTGVEDFIKDNHLEHELFHIVEGKIEKQ